MITVEITIACSVCECNYEWEVTNANELQKVVTEINSRPENWEHPDCPGKDG